MWIYWAFGIVVVLLVIVTARYLWALCRMDDLEAHIKESVKRENQFFAERHTARAELTAERQKHNETGRQLSHARSELIKMLADRESWCKGWVKGMEELDAENQNLRASLDELEQSRDKELQRVHSNGYDDGHIIGMRDGYKIGLREGLTDPRGKSGQFVSWSGLRKQVADEIAAERAAKKQAPKVVSPPLVISDTVTVGGIANAEFKVTVPRTKSIKPIKTSSAIARKQKPATKQKSKPRAVRTRVQGD